MAERFSGVLLTALDSLLKNINLGFHIKTHSLLNVLQLQQINHTNKNFYELTKANFSSYCRWDEQRWMKMHRKVVYFSGPQPPGCGPVQEIISFFPFYSLWVWTIFYFEKWADSLGSISVSWLPKFNPARYVSGNEGVGEVSVRRGRQKNSLRLPEKESFQQTTPGIRTFNSEYVQNLIPNIYGDR